MLKSELFAQKEKYTNIFKIINQVLGFIMPYSSRHIAYKNNTIPRYRVLDIRNEYIRNKEQDICRQKVLEYLHEFQFVLHELKKELSNHDLSIKYFDINKLMEYTDLLQNNIKGMMLSLKINEIQIYSIADIILEFGIVCASFHSYYLNLELLLEEFSIKEEYLYIGFHKPENKDLSYSEFLLVAELLNL